MSCGVVGAGADLVLTLVAIYSGAGACLAWSSPMIIIRRAGEVVATARLFHLKVAAEENEESLT